MNIMKETLEVNISSKSLEKFQEICNQLKESFEKIRVVIEEISNKLEDLDNPFLDWITGLESTLAMFIFFVGGSENGLAIIKGAFSKLSPVISTVTVIASDLIKSIAILTIKFTALAVPIAGLVGGIVLLCTEWQNMDGVAKIITLSITVLSAAVIALNLGLDGAIAKFALIASSVALVVGAFMLIKEKIDEAKKVLGEDASWIDIGKYVVDGIIEGIQSTLENLMEAIKQMWQDFIGASDEEMGIASPSKVMKERGVYIVEGLIEGIKSMIETVIEVFASLWEEILSAFDNVKNAIVDCFKGAISNVKEILVGFKDTITDFFGKKKWKGIADNAKEAIVKCFSDAKTKAWDKITSLFSKKNWQNVVKKGIEGLKKGMSGIKSALKLPKIKLEVSWKTTPKTLYAAAKLLKLQGVPHFAFKAMAQGGFVGKGEMFLAREAGPELVGTIGGSTAVMNNNQIVDAVSNGVYKAVYKAMSKQGSSKSYITLQVDKYKLGTVVVKSLNDLRKRNGKLNLRIL